MRSITYMSINILEFRNIYCTVHVYIAYIVYWERERDIDYINIYHSSPVFPISLCQGKVVAAMAILHRDQPGVRRVVVWSSSMTSVVLEVGSSIGLLERFMMALHHAGCYGLVVGRFTYTTHSFFFQYVVFWFSIPRIYYLTKSIYWKDSKQDET